MYNICLFLFFVFIANFVICKPTRKEAACIHGKDNDRFQARNHEELMKEHEVEETTEEKVPDVIEGDMKVNDLLMSIRKNKKKTAFRDVLTIPQYQWSKEIPYEFSDSAGEYLQQVVLSAIQDLNNFTCVRFIPRTTQDDYVQIAAGTGCWSYVGKIGGKQELSLGSGCEYKGTALHEMLHAMGFFHEHTRLDRDEYVKVNFANVKPGFETNFEKYQAGTADYYGQDYDFDSIMHYRTTAFSSNGNPTIVPLDSSIPIDSIGQRSGLSDIDVLQLNKVFQCDEIGTTQKPTGAGTTNIPVGATSTVSQATSTNTPTTEVIIDLKTTVKPTTSKATEKPTTVKPATSKATKKPTPVKQSTMSPTTMEATTVKATVKSTTVEVITTTPSTTTTKQTTKAPPSNPSPTIPKKVSPITHPSTKAPPSNPSPTPPKIPKMTTKKATTTATAKKIKTTPIPPAPSKPPTPPQTIGDGSEEVDHIFPKVTKIPKVYNGPPLSTPCSDYPCWPHDYSWSMSSTTSNCGCRHIVSDCQCKCFNMDSGITNEGKTDHLCYKRTKHDPLFLWTTKAKLPGKKCLPNPKQSANGQQKYLCYSAMPVYDFQWIDDTDSNKNKLRCIDAYTGTNKLLCGKSL